MEGKNHDHWESQSDGNPEAEQVNRKRVLQPVRSALR